MGLGYWKYLNGSPNILWRRVDILMTETIDVRFRIMWWNFRCFKCGEFLELMRNGLHSRKDCSIDFVWCQVSEWIVANEEQKSHKSAETNFLWQQLNISCGENKYRNNEGNCREHSGWRETYLMSSYVIPCRKTVQREGR
jgi:hypothetical protein